MTTTAAVVGLGMGSADRPATATISMFVRATGIAAAGLRSDPVPDRP